MCHSFVYRVLIRKLTQGWVGLGRVGLGWVINAGRARVFHVVPAPPDVLKGRALARHLPACGAPPSRLCRMRRPGPYADDAEHLAEALQQERRAI